jgi:hypothetical protein
LPVFLCFASCKNPHSFISRSSISFWLADLCGVHFRGDVNSNWGTFRVAATYPVSLRHYLCEIVQSGRCRLVLLILRWFGA